MSDIKILLSEAVKALSSSTSPRIDAEVLMMHVLNCQRAYLYSHAEYRLKTEEVRRYQALVKQRAQGQPVAYLTGLREFWSLPLKVNQHTLIPRAATETLVELCLSLLSKDKPLKLLDLGTGSGAIALALAKESPLWEMYACDQSEQALQVAIDNARLLHLSHIHFFQSNWFQEVRPQLFDAIVSNPPYIAENDPHLSEGDLRFEPKTALISEDQGLQDIKIIASGAKKFLKPGALLAIEHGYQQKDAITSILNELDYYNITCVKDDEGLPRVSYAYRANQ